MIPYVACPIGGREPIFAIWFSSVHSNKGGWQTLVSSQIETRLPYRERDTLRKQDSTPTIPHPAIQPDHLESQQFPTT
jgi:hypothetical protein